ncbi:diacylglycerol kinase family protein [Novosphingobium guangzhouense]|uniref:Diacylglycerol kinase n=1 Tax=Novosphingobium guangzhouense TaxID=1850347 RepID=A0A2K2FSG9_9SPHN|nr:diacylglycerol kinase family protein [Novosphingobium guangzhouense]PNU01708.1 diacylglycerol kinase [Novosphingobium guangzhouense]
MTESGTSSVKVWLVCNAASGSNNDAAVDELLGAFKDAGLAPDRVLRFPDDPAPAPADLDAAGVDMLAVFGGDGTTHSVVMAAYGWGGAVLVLPGGTMNMLAKRMHGDVPAPEIVARLSGGPIRKTRPPVIVSRHGVGLTGALAGPGTVWNEVREAMRAMNVIDFVASTRDAIVHSANGPKVVCAADDGTVDGGREEGYAAITVVPKDDGLRANGYYAESLADYAGQGIALLNRDFRDGPHDELGRHPKLRLVCPTGEPMGLLIDGEPFDGAAEEIFDSGTCEVDLVTTKEFDG